MIAGHGVQFVSAAEITRNFGLWQDRAANGPLVVTHHGRPRCVLLAADLYEAMTASTTIGSGDRHEAVEYSLLAERIHAGFLVLDTQLRVVRANARAALMLGRSAGEAQGVAIDELIPAIAGGPAIARLRRVLRSDEESYVAAPIGEDSEIAMHAFPWPGGLAMLMRMATTREEEAEAEAAARNAALAAHGGVGTARLTVRGTIASVSDAFAKLAGFRPERLAGVRAVDLMALRLRVETGDAIERVLSGQGPQALDGRLLVNGGEEREVRLAFAPLAGGLATAGAEMVVTPR